MSYFKNILATAVLGTVAAACELPVKTTKIETTFGHNSVEVTETSRDYDTRQVYDFNAKTSSTYFKDGSFLKLNMDSLYGTDSTNAIKAAHMLADHKAGLVMEQKIEFVDNTVSVVTLTDKHKLYKLYDFTKSTVDAPYNKIPLINKPMTTLQGKDSLELADIIRLRANHQARRMSI